MVFQALHLGAGGVISGMDIAPDGTMVIRTDTYGAYTRSSPSAAWQQIVTIQSIPSSYLTSQGTLFGIDHEAGVFEIRVAPNNSSRFYMLFGNTTNVQCYRSDNRGTTWTLLSNLGIDTTADANDGNTRTNGPRMSIDPQNSDHVWVGEPSNGVSFTQNGSTTATFTTVSTAQIPAWTSSGVSFGYLVCIDPSSTITSGRHQGIYVHSNGHGLYHSTDGGSTFVHITGSPNSCCQLFVDPNGVVWFGDDPTFNGFFSNFYKYSGSGAWPAALSWTPAASSFAIDPANVGVSTTHVYVYDGSTGKLWVSLDSGATGTALTLVNAFTSPSIGWLAQWANNNGGNGFGASQALTFDPSQVNTVYSPGGVGVAKFNPPTTNVAYTVSDDSVGIEQLNINRISCPPFTAGGGGKPCVAVWDQGCFRADPASGGYPANHGVTTGVFAAGWDCDWASANAAVIVTFSCWSNTDDSGISTDGGQTWTKFTNPPSGAAGANYFAQGGQIAAASATNICAVGVDWNSGFRNVLVHTSDGGTTWTAAVYSGTAPNTAVNTATGWGANYLFWRHTLIADRVNIGTFYSYNDGAGVAAAAGIWKSTNSGANWSNYHSGIIGPNSNGNDQMRAVFGVAGKFYYTNGKLGGGGDNANGGLWRCTDNGSTLTVTKLANVGEVHSFGFGKAKPGGSGAPTIFIRGWVSHVFGFWRSDDDGVTWTSVGDGFPLGSFDNFIAVDGDPNVYGQFYIGGHGGGAYIGSLGPPQ